MTSFQKKKFTLPSHSSPGYDQVFKDSKDECTCGRLKPHNEAKCWVCFDEETIKELSDEA